MLLLWFSSLLCLLIMTCFSLLFSSLFSLLLFFLSSLLSFSSASPLLLLWFFSLFSPLLFSLLLFWFYLASLLSSLRFCPPSASAFLLSLLILLAFLLSLLFCFSSLLFLLSLLPILLVKVDDLLHARVVLCRELDLLPQLRHGERRELLTKRSALARLVPII